MTPQTSSWLLDANVTQVLQEFLSERGISSVTAQDQGWAELTNGNLVQAAVDGGFRVILTRDKLFKESASRTLRRHPDVCIVLLKLPQAKAPELRRLLEAMWVSTPIVPVSGELVLWPK